MTAVAIAGTRGDSFTFEMLVDSGADTTVLNLQAGQLLGFELHGRESRTQISGIGGSLTAIRQPVALRLFECELNIEVSWVLSDRVPLLLGRDVFDYFHVTFKQEQHVTVFKWIGQSGRSVKPRLSS